jgi:erythromycin esterase
MARYFTKQIVFNKEEAINIIRRESLPLKNIKDLDPLLNRIGDAKIVMLGEASHGTHEYYTWRSHITKRLIKEKDFNFIAVEGDWPDCYRINRFIKNYTGIESSAREVLRTFNRWPTWMWANWEIHALIEWLHKYNKPFTANERVGFYGLDVYSLWESMEAIMTYLEKVDPRALKIAEKAFHCFEPYRQDEGRSYAKASMFVPELCENEVVDLLREIRLRLPQYNTDHEAVFSVEQNAIIAVNAEKYYRAMIEGGPHSWNIRDRHMMETLDRLLQFHGKDAKVIVWEHNTHIGDARATDMVDEGMFNIGELARMKHHENGVVLVGFGSYKGSVIAGRRWESKMQEMEMPPAPEDSWEGILHATSADNKLLIMENFMGDVFMENNIGHRAIGVVYQSQYEKYGNYVPTILPMRYDAFIYLDETKALHPLQIPTHGHQIPETYPFGV